MFKKKLTLIIILHFSISFLNAQSDTLFFHNGQTIAGTVVRIAEYTVTYRYIGEEAEKVAGKYAIEKIHYKSGRFETVSKKIEISGEEDWEKVILVDDKSQITALTRIAYITGNTAFINLHTAHTGDKKALIKLQKEAAKLKCAFILLTFDRETKYLGLQGWGATQNKKGGVVFCY
jgi:hypothetical protein